MENMEIYNRVRSVPQAAQKQFNNGRFSGTDINPMWRIKTLTEVFGPSGIGWYYEVLSERSETVGDTVMAIVDINLFIKVGTEWSKPIYGTGGNVLLSKGKASDEGYKMALTDALSVACKALGIGADIYFQADRTKYTAAQEAASAANQESAVKAPGTVPGAGAQRTVPGAPVPSDPASNGQINLSGRPQCMRCGREIERDAVVQYSMKHYGQALCYDCQQKAKRRVTA